MTQENTNQNPDPKPNDQAKDEGLNDMAGQSHAPQLDDIIVPDPNESDDDDGGDEGEEGDEKPTPEDRVKELFADKELGPLLNSRIDTAAAAQTRDVTSRRSTDDLAVKADARYDLLNERFGKMDQEALGEVVLNETGRTEYNEWLNLRESRTDRESQSRINSAAQVHSIADSIVLYQGMLKDADVPSKEWDKNAQDFNPESILNPERYTHLGANGLVVWGKAVYDHLIELKGKAMMDEKWEAYVQEQQANTDGEVKTKAPLPPGSPTPPGSKAGKLTAEKLKVMSTAEVSRLPKEEVQAVLAALPTKG